MSLDHTEVQLGFRARLLQLQVATTGTQVLSAGASGYVRASGSFLADGFAVGMELVASGFAVSSNNDIHVVKSVLPLTMQVSPALATEVAGAGRILSVGLPSKRAWDNVALTPVGGQPYIEEDYVPGQSQLKTFPYQFGDVEDTGLYVVRLYGVANTGLSAISDMANSILVLFKAGTILALPSGQVVRVRGDTAPFRGTINADEPGWSVCTVTIPWRARYTN